MAQQAGDRTPVIPVAAIEHPDKLAKNNQADDPGIIDRAACFDQAGGNSCLFLVILNDMPDKHIGVDPDHWRAPLAMAESISASVRALFGLGTAPLRLFREATMGITSNLPSCLTTNSSFVPGRIRRALRASTGMV